MLARPEADNKPEKEENVFKHAWHSVEQALHLKSDPHVEEVPPPGTSFQFISFHSILDNTTSCSKRRQNVKK